MRLTEPDRPVTVRAKLLGDALQAVMDYRTELARASGGGSSKVAAKQTKRRIRRLNNVWDRLSEAIEEPEYSLTPVERDRAIIRA